MRRRTLLKAAAGAAMLGVIKALVVHAQASWPQPGRTVKVIVPWPPGAANDALGRLLAQKLQERYGASTVVENRTGAAGLIGTNAVIQAEPDGYTLLASAFNTAVMPMVVKGATFDPQVDLEVMARTAVAPLVLVVTGARSERSVGDLIANAMPFCNFLGCRPKVLRNVVLNSLLFEMRRFSPELITIPEERFLLCNADLHDPEAPVARVID